MGSQSRDVEARLRALEQEVAALRGRTGNMPVKYSGKSTPGQVLTMVETFTDLPDPVQTDPPAIAYVKENMCYYGLVYKVARWVFESQDKPTPEVSQKMWMPMMVVRSRVTSGTGAAKHPFGALVLHTEGEQSLTLVKDESEGGTSLTHFVVTPNLNI